MNEIADNHKQVAMTNQPQGSGKKELSYTKAETNTSQRSRRHAETQNRLIKEQSQKHTEVFYL